VNKYKALLGEIKEKSGKKNSGTDMEVSWIPSDVIGDQVPITIILCSDVGLGSLNPAWVPKVFFD
jgi:hypothetical protein